MDCFKKKFFNLAWARQKCGSDTLPPPICNYIKSFAEPVDPKAPLDTISFIVFDCETTGLNPKKDHILSIGAVKIKGREIHVSDSFEEMVHYDRDPNRESLIVHGILPSQSLMGTEEKIVMENLLDFFGNSILVAHHAVFDISIVNQALKQHFDIKLYNRHIDTMLLAMRLENFNRSQDQLVQNRYNLDSLCLRYQIPQEERHTAVGDAFITGQLMVKLLRKAQLRGITTIGELLK